MLERSATLQSLTARLRAYRAAVAPHAARAWALTKLVAGKTARVSKRIFLATLEVIEKTLLSHSGRERTQAVAVFTLIFAFGVTSIDFLLTGGPELSQGARAAPYTSQASLISARTPTPMGELAYAAPVQTIIGEGVIEDATVTPLSARAPTSPDVADLADAPEALKPELVQTDAPATADRTKAKDAA